MSIAKKLPSGSWRCRASYMEDVPRDDGSTKRIRRTKSFTSNNPGRAGKREAEAAAAAWLASRQVDQMEESCERGTFRANAENYICSREGTLSPRTIMDYRATLRNYLPPLASTDINEITQDQVQRLVDDLYRKRNGEYFLHGQGHALTKWACSYGDMSGWGEEIVPMTEEEAREWAEKHLDGEEYEEIFGAIEEDEADLASTLKQLRQSTGLSQSDFAAQFEIPFRTYQNWENGTRQPAPYIVSLIKKALKIDE